MPSVASSNPTLPPDAFACWWRPCGVTWDAVSKVVVLKLRRTRALDSLFVTILESAVCFAFLIWSQGRFQEWISICESIQPQLRPMNSKKAALFPRPTSQSIVRDTRSSPDLSILLSDDSEMWFEFDKCRACQILSRVYLYPPSGSSRSTGPGPNPDPRPNPHLLAVRPGPAGSPRRQPPLRLRLDGPPDALPLRLPAR